MRMEDEGGGRPSYRNLGGLVEVFSLTRTAASVLLLPCIQVHVAHRNGADQPEKATALETIQKCFQRINRSSLRSLSRCMISTVLS